MISTDDLLGLAANLDDSDYQVREQAIKDVLAADPTGEAVIPLIVRHLTDPQASRWAAAALENLVQHVRYAQGGEAPLLNVLRGAIPELLALAKHESEFTRLAALELFGLLGPSTEEVQQAVIAGLADESDWVKQSACLAIKAWGPAGAPAVGMLIPLLRSAVDEYACDALRAIGPAAAPALSVLRERARRADPSGRDHAKQAIAAITAGQPAGVKPAKATPPPPSAGGLAIGEKESIPLGGARPQVFALAPDGRSIALSAGDRVSRRRLEDGEELFSYRLGIQVTQVAFSPDGELIAVAGWEGNLRVLRAEGGQVFVSFSASGANFTERPVFSPDGRLLAFVTDPPGISVWDRESGEARLISVAGPPLAVVFDSNGGEGTPILVPKSNPESRLVRLSCI
jgi:hypothetical protein